MNLFYLNRHNRHKMVYLPLMIGALVMTSAVGTASAPGFDGSRATTFDVQLKNDNSHNIEFIDVAILQITASQTD